MPKKGDDESCHKLLEHDGHRRAAQRNLSCGLAVICVVAIVCSAVLALSLYQISVNLKCVEGIKNGRLRLSPPISNYLQTQSPAGDGVEVASGGLKFVWPDPPPHDQVAMVARYIVHISDWASIATFSVASMIEGFPFANILSLSDGPIEKSSGVPYMYITPMDLTSHDLANDSRASLSMTEAQSSYCHKNHYDPESPLCARILITGHIVKVETGSEEEEFARNAVFSRHPEMKEWPVGHQWYFAKMNITHIYVLDFFGGASEVNVEEYFEADPF